MLDGPALAKAFDRNRKVIRAQVEGLDHDDSLVLTEFRINSLNWVIGHIVEYRSWLVETLTGERPVSADQTARYRKESDPVNADGPGVMRLEQLLEVLEYLRRPLEDALLADRDWQEEIEVDGRIQTLAGRAHFLFWHDTYHTGQTELLRQVAGADDKVI